MIETGFLGNLFGDIFYQMPDKNNSPIRFLNKPTGKVTFFIRASELKVEHLTELLKKIVVATEIPKEEVSFGRIERPATTEDFCNMHTQYGVIFDINYANRKDLLPWPEGKECFIVSTLMDMASSDSAKRKTWDVLKNLKDKLSSLPG